MKRFIFLSFAFLGLGFYELSGGSAFDPVESRASLIEMRQAREAGRLAALPQPSASAADATLQQSAATAARSGTPGQNDVTRASLNLVTFEAAAQRDAPAPVPTNKPEPADALPAAPQIPAETGELSIAALETAPGPADTVAFAGRSVTASSQSLVGTTDIRTVKGTLVNMRSGPGTDYDVVDQLAQSTRVEVLSDTGNGWVELRPLEGGPTGWIAAFLLTDG